MIETMTIYQKRVREQDDLAREKLPGILRKVATATGVPATVFCGARYFSNIDRRTWARVLAMACCVAEGLDFNTTARAFYRTRQAVIAAIHRLDAKWLRDEEFRAMWLEVTGRETSPGKLLYQKRAPRKRAAA